MLRNGSCAIEGCEPCQVGNQAALSSLFGVPQGCLFGAKSVVNVCKNILDLAMYGLTQIFGGFYAFWTLVYGESLTCICPFFSFGGANV